VRRTGMRIVGAELHGPHRSASPARPVLVGGARHRHSSRRADRARESERRPDGLDLRPRRDRRDRLPALRSRSATRPTSSSATSSIISSTIRAPRRSASTSRGSSTARASGVPPRRHARRANRSWC
jgi:hypothetical protein